MPRRADSFITSIGTGLIFFLCGSSKFLLLVIKRGFFLMIGQESTNLLIEELDVKEKLE